MASLNPIRSSSQKDLLIQTLTSEHNQSASPHRPLRTRDAAISILLGGQYGTVAGPLEVVSRLRLKQGCRRFRAAPEISGLPGKQFPCQSLPYYAAKAFSIGSCVEDTPILRQ